MRYIIFSLTMLLWPLHANAAPELPAQSVWVAPATAEVGAEIELSAFVYNNTEKDASVTVSFAASEKAIDTVTVSVPKQSAKVASVSWSMPAEAVKVTATVTKAVDANKKDISSLRGTLGTVNVGGTALVEAAGSTFPGVETLKGWWRILLQQIENFRAKQALHFAALRDEAKKETGITVRQGIGEMLAPDVPAAPETPAEPTPAKEFEFMPYVKLIYATFLAALFSNIAIFYISLVLAVLLAIRFIIRLF